jgi:hypothetical protein
VGGVRLKASGVGATVLDNIGLVDRLTDMNRGILLAILSILTVVGAPNLENPKGNES